MAAQQQQHIQINGQQLGLTRSRHTLGDGAAPSAKKPRSGPRSWVHAAAEAVKDSSGKITGHTCAGCKENASPNVTRLKEHLLKCLAFLRSEKAEELAATAPELREAIAAAVGCGGDARSRARLAMPGSH